MMSREALNQKILDVLLDDEDCHRIRSDEQEIVHRAVCSVLEGEE